MAIEVAATTTMMTMYGSDGYYICHCGPNTLKKLLQSSIYLHMLFVINIEGEREEELYIELYLSTCT